MDLRQLMRLALVIALVGSFAVPAAVGQGTPSQATLEAMGLGDMQIMSDDQALAIRGFGYGGDDSYAVAYGYSWASIHAQVGSAGSENGYLAAGSHYASGANFSEAGVEMTVSGGGHHGKAKDAHGNSGKHDGGKSAHHGGKGGGKHGRKYGKHDGGKHGSKGGARHGGACHDIGKSMVKAVKVFAGGFSYASAK